MKQHYTDDLDAAVDVSDTFEPMKGKKDHLKRSQRKQEKQFREMRKRGRGRKYSLS